MWHDILKHYFTLNGKNCAILQYTNISEQESDQQRCLVRLQKMENSWFLLDVTKIQNKELLILLRFYFHEELKPLKTCIFINFHSERVIRFVIRYAWISNRLPDMAFTWRPRESSCNFKRWLSWGISLSEESLYRRKGITFYKQGGHKGVTLPPSVREVPSSIPADTTSLFQLLSSLCNFV